MIVDNLPELTRRIPFWGLLFIDCYQANGAMNEFYLRVVRNLVNFPISVSINCSNNIFLDSNEKSIKNTIKHYRYDQRAQDDIIRRRVLSDIVMYSGSQPMSNMLEESVFDSNTVFLSNRETFHHHVTNYYPDVKDWIVIGAAWNICLHNSPLGFNTLVDLSEYRFHVFPEWSIVRENNSAVAIEDLENDQAFVWAKVGKKFPETQQGGYQLITRATNNVWFQTQ
jgi:hypothetical protein